MKQSQPTKKISPLITTTSTRTAFLCNKCNHVWSPLTSSPVRCPKCKTYFSDLHATTRLTCTRTDNYVPSE